MLQARRPHRSPPRRQVHLPRPPRRPLLAPVRRLTLYCLSLPSCPHGPRTGTALRPLDVHSKRGNILKHSLSWSPMPGGTSLVSPKQVSRRGQRRNGPPRLMPRCHVRHPAKSSSWALCPSSCGLAASHSASISAPARRCAPHCPLLTRTISVLLAEMRARATCAIFAGHPRGLPQLSSR